MMLSERLTLHKNGSLAFVAMLSLLLICVHGNARAAADDTIRAAQEQDANGSRLTDEAMRREIELFGDAEVSLRQALKIAGGLRPGSRIVDVSFDGGSGAPVYRVKMFQQDRIWEDAIDAKTGRVAGHATVSSLRELNLEDRFNLIAMQSVQQELADAVIVAEDNTSGKALSGGLMSEAGKLNFVIVVLSGADLKQVILEPPRANNLQSLPRRLKRH